MFDATTQTPTLIGCNLLTIHQTQAGFTTLCLVFPAAISEALNYDTTFCILSKSCKSFARLSKDPFHTGKDLHRKANPFSTRGQRRGPAL
jgi:hypothetical protein